MLDHRTAAAVRERRRRHGDDGRRPRMHLAEPPHNAVDVLLHHVRHAGREHRNQLRMLRRRALEHIDQLLLTAEHHIRIIEPRGQRLVDGRRRTRRTPVVERTADRPVQHGNAPRDLAQRRKSPRDLPVQRIVMEDVNPLRTLPQAPLIVSLHSACLPTASY